jgi:hypothetical protein
MMERESLGMRAPGGRVDRGESDDSCDASERRIPAARRCPNTYCYVDGDPECRKYEKRRPKTPLIS